LISAKGELFRSASETNRYGEIPSLNPLFIGTGGIFALPTAITLKITKVNHTKPLQ
jgi:FAD/FMN-containing dehydrogenase